MAKNKFQKSPETLASTEKYFFEDVYKFSVLYCTFAPFSCKGMLIIILFTGAR